MGVRRAALHPGLEDECEFMPSNSALSFHGIHEAAHLSHIRRSLAANPVVVIFG
jgi:hypothetical protein